MLTVDQLAALGRALTFHAAEAREIVRAEHGVEGSSWLTASFWSTERDNALRKAGLPSLSTLEALGEISIKQRKARGERV